MTRKLPVKPEDLALSVCNAQYDITAECLSKLSEKLSEKSIQSGSLWIGDISNIILEAKSSMDLAWDICKDRMEGECARHPKHILGYDGTIDELTNYLLEIPKTDFIKFIHGMSVDLSRQADADMYRGRIGRRRLASYLYQASGRLQEAEYLAGNSAGNYWK